MMVLPAFVVYLLVMAFPIGLSIVLSVSNYNGGRMFGGEHWGFAGFGQYLRTVADPYSGTRSRTTRTSCSCPYSVNCLSASSSRISSIGKSSSGRILAGRPLCSRYHFDHRRRPPVADRLFARRPLGEFMNSIYRHAFEAKLSGVFASAGGFNVSDELVKKILNLAGPSGSAMFSNPVSDLKDFILSYPPGHMAQVLNDLTNLFAKKWSPDFLNKPDLAMLPVLFVILWMYTGMYSFFSSRTCRRSTLK